MNRYIRAVKWTVALMVMVCVVAGFTFTIWAGIQNQHRYQVQQQQQVATNALNASLVHTNAANTERAASNQLLLLNYTRQLAAREDALLGYLRKHGIKLPTRLVTVIPPPTLERIVVPSTVKRAVIAPTPTAPARLTGKAHAPGQLKKHRR